MSEDAGAAATDSASQEAQPQVRAAGITGGVPTTVWSPPAGTATGGTGGTGGTATAAPDTGDQGAEALLAAAVAAGDGDGQEGASGAEGDPLKAAEAEIARWKAQARKQEERAKANAAKARDFDAYQESQKTEAQKRDEALAQAQKEAAEAKSYNWRLMACVKYDLEADDMDDLRGSTEDEIDASAERLARKINERAAKMAVAAAQAQATGQQQPRNGGYRGPVENLRAAGLPASDNRSASPSAWIRDQIASKKQ